MWKLLERWGPSAGRARPLPVSEWFRVHWDAAAIYVSSRPQGGQSWATAIAWGAITRVCFKAEGYAHSDGIHLFSAGCRESLVVPIEARGGEELWAELLRRGLFDAELAIRAMRASDGLFCWPPQEAAGRRHGVATKARWTQ